MEKNVLGFKLASYKKVVIGGHISPDGDSIGACLALAMALKKCDTEVVVLLEPFLPKYNFIAGIDLIKEKIDDDYEFDVFIALDCGSKDRLGDAVTVFDRAPVTINIDHHRSNTNFAQFNIVDSNASATCEILYDILVPIVMIDSDIASALLCGIIYDTGGFCHSTTSFATFSIVGQLLKCNVPYSKIYTELINIRTISEAKLLARAIYNMEKLPFGNIVVSTLSIEEIAAENTTALSVDNIVNYLKNIKNIEVVAFIYEKDKNIVKISLRSENNIDVSHIAGLLSGGGHKYAAGANFNGSLDEAKQKVIEVLENTFLSTDSTVNVCNQ